MVIDSSALVAILQDEPERSSFNRAIEASDRRAMSVVSFVETSMIIESRFSADGIRDLDLFIAKAGIEIIAVDAEQGHIARTAFRDYGKRRPGRPQLRRLLRLCLGQDPGRAVAVQGNGLRSMTNRERVLALIRSEPPGLTDSEIRERTGIRPHQQVNQICRSLAQAGLIARRPGPHGRLVNLPTASLSGTSPPIRGRSPRAGSGKPPHGRAGPAGAAEMPPLSIPATLFVLPCSKAKRRGGRCASARATSVLRSLPRDLAAELRTRRSENAPRAKLDESELLPAADRYTGALYRAAGDAPDALANAGAHLLIISGGYGVVRPAEPIGWYDQEYRNAMWPEGVVARCLAAYADAIDATTVVGLLSATTQYARVFRSTRWTDRIEHVLLVSPEPTAGAMVKAPRAQGEALKEFSREHTLRPGWTSSDGLGMQITRIR